MDDSLSPAAAPSRCSRESHDAIRADVARFAALSALKAPHNTMPTYADAGEPDTLLLADCPGCSSTLCREVYAADLVASELARDLAAAFQPPPSAADILNSCDLIPVIRWAFREAGDCAHLLDVLHHVEIDGRYVSCVSLIAAERDCGVWEFRAIDGAALDRDSEILLDGELKRERRGDACLYRIDESDMAIERYRIAVEARAARAA